MNELDRIFVALSDSTRRSILDRLRRGPATVTQLAEPFDVSQQAISKHLACLERACLIDKRRFGRQQFCVLRASTLRGALDWMEHYRRQWSESFEQLDALLEEMKRRKERRHVRKQH